jgi:hypothetical protein
MVGEVSERRLQPTVLTRNEVIVLHQTDDVRAGEPDRPVKDSDFMEIIRVDQEVVRPIQMGHPFLVRAILRPVLTDDQLVLAQAPQAINQLLYVGDTIERLDDKGQPRPILVLAR